MSEKQLIGNFYYQRTEYRNLIGEFTNNKTEIVISESADFISIIESENPDSGIGNQFLGQYNSSWRQGNDVFRLTLKITRRHDSKFSLTWRNENGVTEYEGEGFMVGEMLIGYYIQN